MILDNFSFQSGDKTMIYVYRWSPDAEVPIKGVVQIAHGMAETAARYEGFANKLTQNGYLVYANDHRGHGKTAGSLEKVGYLGDKDGFEWLIKDMYQLSLIIKEEYPDLPLFLFGHSMGSFATQRYLVLYGEHLKGAIISGSNGRSYWLHTLGYLIAKIEVNKRGRKAKSNRMNQLSFGNYNRAFRPNRTDFDWLSRDEKEVDKFIKDPYCGEVFTAGFFYDFMKTLRVIDQVKQLEKIPKTLPIFIFSGDKDPVGANGKGVHKLYQMYKKSKLKDVTMKLYPGGRHEMLNETNKEEVMDHCIRWINNRI